MSAVIYPSQRSDHTVITLFGCILYLLRGVIALCSTGMTLTQIFEAVSVALSIEKLDKMSAKCEAVIDANVV